METPIKCIVVDDEPLARQGIEEYIRDVDFLKFNGAFDQALKATDCIAAGEADLVFMDIEMPKISGMQFFKNLQQPPPVIFITAYPEFALEGFEVNALDYLLKPVSFARFLKAALKARDFFEVRQSNQGRDKNYFFIKADNKLVRISYDELLFVEALQNYVCLQTTSKKYICYLTFKAVEDYLPVDRFIKTHKSFIVAADKIAGIDGNDISIGTYHIPISRNLRDMVMEKLVNGKILKR
jgi:DNA-binding LytR/AlgR family response regulator